MSEAQLDKQPKVPEKIDLPTDENLQRQLAAKFEEYEAREKPYVGHYQAPDSPIARSVHREYMKELLLSIVLTEGTITYQKFKELIDQGYPGLSAIEDDIQQVFEIISDYCLTGGKNLAGGTGLAEFNEWDELPKVLSLPDDEEKLKMLAQLLEIADEIAETPIEDQTGGELINAYKRIILGTLLVNDSLEIEKFITEMKEFGGYDEVAAAEAVRSVAVHL